MEDKTIPKIEEVLKRIRTHPEYSSHVAGRVLENLRKEADRHSVAFEAEAGERSTTKDVENLKVHSYKSLVVARNFLAKEGINNYSLSKLGCILEPELNPTGGFRTRSVNFGGFEGTDPLKILYEISDLASRLEDISIHPIRRATDAHISLVKTHPYFDGNGRAARLVQDICLEGAAYPPGVITTSDRGLYIRLMNKTIEDRVSGRTSVYSPSESEGLFQEFISSKIFASAQKLEEELQNKRYYDVTFKGVGSPDLAMKIKHLLYGRSTEPLHVRLETPKTGKIVSFCASGKISQDELYHRARKISEKYGLKFSCTIRQGCVDTHY